MLKTRILTALGLFALFFSALFLFSPLAWVGFSTLIGVIAAWEWGGLMACRMRVRCLLGLGLLAVAATVAVLAPEALGLGAGSASASVVDAWQLGRWFYLPAAAFWLLVVPLWMRWRMPLPKAAAGAVLSVFVGALVILPTWLAFIQLRLFGAGALVAVMAIAWVADIAAYFSGRAFGRHKLAPAISPGKTWEGAIGGGIAVLAYGFALAPQLPASLAGRPWLLVLVLLVLTAFSVVGDLFESLLKRQAGLKDSSGILPGHGGVLDRIDSLTSILPLVALVWLYTAQ